MAMVDNFSSPLRTYSLIEAFTYIDTRTNTHIYVHTQLHTRTSIGDPQSNGPGGGGGKTLV